MNSVRENIPGKSGSLKSYDQKWSLVQQLCTQEGVELFDLVASGNQTSGVLKVFITTKNGVQHSHCSAVSNKILNHEQVEELLPGNTILEVSSPGINRKLTRFEHFLQAQGERVKISFRDENEKKVTKVGILQEANKDKLSLLVDENIVPINTGAVVEARIDFLFK